MAKDVFKTYFLFFYFLPLVLFVIFGWHSNFIELTSLELSFGILVLCLCTFMVFFASNSDKGFKSLIFINTEALSVKILVLFYSLMFFCLALIMRSKFNISFRHSGPTISEAGMVAQFFLMTKSLAAPFVIFFLKLVYEKIHLDLFFRVSALLFAISFALFPIAAFDLIFFALFATIALLGVKAHSLFSIGSFKAILLIIPLALFVIYLGISTKLGFEGAYKLFVQNQESLLRYLQYRQGIYFFSTLINYSDINNLFFSWIDGLVVTYEMISYRIGVLVGADVVKPVVPNLNVLNFSNIFLNYSETKDIGASPGIVGAFSYLLPFPLSVLALVVFVSFLSKCINCSFGKSSGIGYSLPILVCFMGVFNNPLHVFTALGPDVLKSVILVLILLVRVKKYV